MILPSCTGSSVLLLLFHDTDCKAPQVDCFGTASQKSQRIQGYWSSSGSVGSILFHLKRSMVGIRSSISIITLSMDVALLFGKDGLEICWPLLRTML